MDTKKLRQKILDLAIHGKLVPQDPNDEPASVLLERIRAEKERLIAEGKIKRSKKATTSDTPHYENVPFEVPENWIWIDLNSICSKIVDGDHNPPSGEDCPTKYRMLSSKNINCNTIVNIDDCRYLSEHDWKICHSRTRLNKGDVLLTTVATLGRSCVVETDEPICFQRSVTILTTLIYNKYLKYVFDSNYYQELMTDTAKGTAQKGFYINQVVDSIIPLPPLAEQMRIVHAVSQWTSFIDSIESCTADLLQSIQSAKSKILDLAIHGKLVPQNPNDEPASELLKRINPKAVVSCDNPHYENIPSSWVCTTMGSIFNHNTGKALNKSASVEGNLLPYLTTSNVYWNTFDLSVVKEMRFKETEIEKCSVKKGDLLVCEGGDIGRSAIWDKDYTICIQNHLHRLRPKGNVVPLLYLYYIMHLKLTGNLEGKGIGLQGFSSGLLDKLEVPLPPYKEQMRIVGKIQETFNILDSIADTLN